MAIDSFFGKYRFLSNFYPSPRTPPTLEHHYQASKAASEMDRICVLNASSPGEAKRIGRGIELRHDWSAVKRPIMLNLLRVKFTDPVLRQALLSTGDAMLVEGNHWHDNYWGACWCYDCIASHKAGENWLGKLLMKVRNECR